MNTYLAILQEMEKMNPQVNDIINPINLAWLSDWDGYEVGYDNVNVVGLYKVKDSDVYLYINMENNTVLERWEDAE